MRVYKDRLPNLRVGRRDRGPERRRAAVHRLRRAAHRLHRVLPAGQLGVGRAARRLRRRSRRPGGRAVGQQPRVVPELLGHGRHRRRSWSGSTAGGRPTRSSTACRTRRAGPRGRPGPVRADRRRARRAAGPRGGVPDRRRPGRLRRRPAPAPLRRADRRSPSPTFPDVAIDEGDSAVIFYTSGTTGRPKGAISSHRNMIANLQNTIFNTVAHRGCWRRDDRRAPRRRRADDSPADLTAVPRVGLPLEPGRRHAGRPEAGDPRGPLRARQGARAHPGRAGHDLGDRADDGVAGVRVPRPARLRHVERHLGGLRRVTVGRRAAADGARDVPEREEHHQRLRPDRVELGGHGDQRSRRAGQADLGRSAGAGRRDPHRRPVRGRGRRRARPARC